MLFTSYKFIGFVILLTALYYVLPKKAKWPLLLLGSYVFYFFAGWKFLFYIAGVTVITYIAGLLISSNKKKADARFSEMKLLEKSGEGSPEEVGKEARKRFKEEQKKKRRRIMAIGITLALLILAVVKYTKFTIYNINGIL